MKQFLIIVFFSSLFFSAFSQQDSASLANDSIARAKAAHKKNYSGPRRASTMSAIIPGLGQAYNKQYWKIPVIYAGFVGLGYYFIVNQRQYAYFRKNLIAANDNDSNTVNQTRWSSDDLRIQKLAYEKKRDVAAIGIVILYVLNIIDANVSAHLKTFDVSDDLSIHISPWQSFYSTGLGFNGAAGLSIKLKFK